MKALLMSLDGVVKSVLTPQRSQINTDKLPYNSSLVFALSVSSVVKADALRAHQAIKSKSLYKSIKSERREYKRGGVDSGRSHVNGFIEIEIGIEVGIDIGTEIEVPYRFDFDGDIDFDFAWITII
jgi:hypothetical protein